LYKLKEGEQSDPKQKKVTVITKRPKDRNIKAIYESISDPPNYRVEVSDVVFKCDESKFAFVKTEFWSASNELVNLLVVQEIKFSEFPSGSPFGTLQQIVCDRPYGGIGIRIELTKWSDLSIAEVFNNSPAEKAGLKVHDVISRIDNEAVNNWTT